LLKELTNLEALPVSAVILDPSGTIVGVNNAWKEFGRRNGLSLRNSGIGANYLTHCGDGGSGSGVARELRELLSGRRDLVMHVYPCNSPGEKRWFMLLAFPLSLTAPSGIAILHAEISSFVPLPVVESKGGHKPGKRVVLTQPHFSLSSPERWKPRCRIRLSPNCSPCSGRLRRSARRLELRRSEPRVQVPPCRARV
jgi:hypothetical protein